MVTLSEQPEIICGAKTTQGPCQNQPVTGKKRCLRHGGAPGVGAPQGNKNSWKHGYYSAAAIAERKRAKEILVESQGFLRSIMDL